MNGKTKNNRVGGKRAAFTLVELLVVISIIALLVSILLPALSKARGQAKNVICMSNLRQISLGAFMWSDDHDEWVLPATWSHIDDKTGVYRARLEKYLDAQSQGKDIYRCPIIKENEAGGWDSETGKYTEGKKISYGINLYLCSKKGGGATPNDYWGPASVYFYEHGNTRLSSVPRPGEIVYIMDFFSYGVSDSAFGLTWEGASITHREKGRRHDIGVTRKDAGKANITWVDGHVSIEPGDFEQYDSSGRFGDAYSIKNKYFNWWN